VPPVIATSKQDLPSGLHRTSTAGSMAGLGHWITTAAGLVAGAVVTTHSRMPAAVRVQGGPLLHAMVLG
jgi:hypothetical protein